MPQSPEEKRAKQYERVRRWRAAHPGRIAELKRKKRLENLEEHRAKDRAWYHRRAKPHSYTPRRYISSEQARENRRAYGRAYYAANRLSVLAKRKLWGQKHAAAEHARLRRYQALKRGSSLTTLTLAQWQEILVAYGHRCVYCQRKLKRLTQDHIIPVSKGGEHTVHNVVPACRSCNSRKNDGPPLKPVQPLLLTISPAKK